MPHQQNIEIVEYIDSDDEVPSPAQHLQTHTQVEASATGLSWTRTYYDVPASPRKQPVRQAESPIGWREDVSMHIDDAVVYDMDEEQTDPVENMSNPGYVSTARDEVGKPRK